LSPAREAEEVFASMPAELLANDVAADRARGWILMARCLLHDGQVSDAQNMARRAVDAYERLNDDAGSCDIPLASALSALNLTLVGDDVAEQALETSTAVVRIRRRLAAANPEAFDDDLAHALTNQAVDLAALGRYDEAADTTSAAVEIRRRLARAHPQAHGLSLVGALLNLVQDLLDSDRMREALDVSREAIETIDKLDGVDPDQWVLAYGRAATTYAKVRARTGTDLDRALLAAMQSMKAFGELLKDNPADLVGPMVNAAHVLADVHEARGDIDKAADIRGRFPPLRED
jgi:tetratricopeptide (TPR) repeat protein